VLSHEYIIEAKAQAALSFTGAKTVAALFGSVKSNKQYYTGRLRCGFLYAVLKACLPARKALVPLLGACLTIK
jgi:hypothetical protein